VARIVFRQEFSGDTCVSIEARPAGRQLGEEVLVRFGEHLRRFVTAQDSPHWYRLDFPLAKPADTLHIAPSEPAKASTWDASNADPRVLGLALHRLVVVPGRCEVQASAPDGS